MNKKEEEWMEYPEDRDFRGMIINFFWGLLSLPFIFFIMIMFFNFWPAFGSVCALVLIYLGFFIIALIE